MAVSVEAVTTFASSLQATIVLAVQHWVQLFTLHRWHFRNKDLVNRVGLLRLRLLQGCVSNKQDAGSLKTGRSATHIWMDLDSETNNRVVKSAGVFIKQAQRRVGAPGAGKEATDALSTILPQIRLHVRPTRQAAPDCACVQKPRLSRPHGKDQRLACVLNLLPTKICLGLLLRLLRVKFKVE